MQAQVSPLPDKQLSADALMLLQQLISIPSLSREEDKTATAIEDFLKARKIITYRKLNNVWAYNQHFNPALPTILLNSHHDTVKPNSGYTKNPFEPVIENGKLYGLGSNDAGGCLVSLMATFLHFYSKPDLKYNILFAATAEEEISGTNGIELVYPEFKNIDFAIVGEPTLMQIAVAEKGLLVLDCTVKGKSGHAAREEGDNAIYKAIKDIEWFRTFQFPKVSPHLGKVKMSVTEIHSGTQHNVVPDNCKYVVDIRLTDSYTHEEALDVIKQHIQSSVQPRSTRMKPSHISEEHPIVKAGKGIGLTTYGSPTTSDQALIPAPSLKIGPGDSARSHSADEFIFVEEIEKGIATYIKILEQII
jgi:acetylornithine deacetylase